MRIEVREINSFKWLGFIELPEMEGWGARVVWVAPPRGTKMPPIDSDVSTEEVKTVCMETTWLRHGLVKIPICLCDVDDWNKYQHELKRSIMG